MAAAFLIALLMMPPLAVARAADVVSQGTFTDAHGGKHPWRINAAHALVWDDRPYLPVGGRFDPHSWNDGEPTEADWAADVAALGLLKKQGVTDLYVQPAGGVGLTRVKPGAIQRLLNHLDKEEFTYGIAINDGPRDALIGYVVRPGAFRQEGVASGGTSVEPLRFAVPDVISSLYLAVAQRTSEVIAEGDGDIVENGVRVPVPTSGAGNLAVFLIPERVFSPQSGLGMPNLWDGFDAYRDALLLHLSQVRPGKGFRFWASAIGPNLAWRDEWERIVPTSKSFQTEWAAWLSTRYKSSVDALQRAWGVQGADLREIDEAAQLIPLWNGGKGIEAFYHRGTRGRVAARSTERSAFWPDLARFKAQSVQGYMNALADVLKREIADVPVVYRSGGYSPLFAALPAQGGFDGIGIDAYGQGRDLVTHAAGYVYAQATEAPKTIWLPVTGTAPTMPATPATPGAPAAPGYGSRAALLQDLDWLREIGAKGFFVDSPGFVEAPEPLTWLRDYKNMLLAITGPAEFRPKALFYPRSSSAGGGGGAQVASLKPLASGGWWLPSDQPAKTYNFGPAGRAYSLQTEQGTVYYLWNPRPRTVRLRIPPPVKGASVAPTADVLSSDPNARWNRNKTELTLHIGPDPVSVRNLPFLPIPLETFPEMAQEAEALIALTRGKGDYRAGRDKSDLQSMRGRYKEDNPLPAILALEPLLEILRHRAAPYAWAEAEPVGVGLGHSFDEADERPGASNGKTLTVGARAALGGAAPARAAYSLLLTAPAAYTLWVAMTPGGAPLSFRLDGQPFLPGATGEPAGAVYAGGLVWHRFGSAALAAGRHTLEVNAGTGPATLDVLLLTRDPFVPDGPNPPPILAPSALDNRQKR